tara:strand:+ start:7816 stop:8481 length:666 start_codon:yes stop_codon:yes gene_type:complete
LTIQKLFDRCAASLVLVLISVPFLIVLAIKLLVDGRPIFYVSERIGLENRKIKVIKLRTMVDDQKFISDLINMINPGGGFQRLDPKCVIYTKLGRVCEVTQLVEVPQLINVIKGEMALVGNRPLPKEINQNLAERFGDELVDLRMAVLPGISGVSQVIGKNELTDHERLTVENKYVAFIQRHASYRCLMFNLVVIFETIIQILSRGALKPFRRYIRASLDQ